MKFRRNSPCPCGSGKKYKHCHYGKPFLPSRDLSLLARNRILLTAALDIFGFAKGRSWADFKRNISGKEIREFYEVQAGLWMPDTNWAQIIPGPDGRLRALYLGDIRPELIPENLIRFSLYTDEILVVDPFHNPWRLQAEYNPIDNPDQFKTDTLKLIYFLSQMDPWIRSGIVKLIPDPGDFYPGLKMETWRLAEARRAGQPLDPGDLEDGRRVGFEELRRVLLARPAEEIVKSIEESGERLTEKQKKELLSYARRELRNDPIAWEQPLTEQHQLMVMRSGANLETALLIAQITGAFPYTNMSTRWTELMSAHEKLTETARVWSPLTKAFQGLEFRFLNNVDISFAQSIREDGRLETFRAFLRRLGRDAIDLTEPSVIENYVRDRKDELVSEYRKAQAEWDKIDQAFLKWASTGLVGSLIGGHMWPDISSLAAATATTVSQLIFRYLKQQQFRKVNPMSVFIDLSRRNPRGGTTLL